MGVHSIRNSGAAEIAGRKTIIMMIRNQNRVKPNRERCRESVSNGILVLFERNLTLNSKNRVSHKLVTKYCIIVERREHLKMCNMLQL
jgi:hypothetical protein